MSYYKYVDDGIEAVLALAAIAAITYLAFNGVFKLEVLGLIATLGGAKSYRKFKNGN